MAKAKRYAADSEHVLVLRACQVNMESRNGFKYPKRGPVRDTKWKPIAECGHGLHGWLWGLGARGVVPSYVRDGGKWLVIRVLRKHIINLTGKVKFPKGTVVFCGQKRAAGAYIRARRPSGVGNGTVELSNHMEITLP